MCFSMGKGRKVLQKIYLGIIGGVCGSFFILVFGYLWHSFLGHSHGFGFFSLNIVGWVFLYCFAAFVGGIIGVIVGLVGLLEKSWLTLMTSLLLWGARPSIEVFHAVNRTGKAIYLDGGYVVLSILAAILCTLIVVKGSGVVAVFQRKSTSENRIS